MKEISDRFRRRNPRDIGPGSVEAINRSTMTNPPPGHTAQRWLRSAIEKWADAPSCMSHLFQCTVASTFFSTFQRKCEIFIRAGFFKSTTVSQIPVLAWPLPSTGLSSSRRLLLSLLLPTEWDLKSHVLW
ncbi:hypothetical protein TNCV_3947321 [Trichonephila clavipes]|nr:hypothetical protein TNCV_3947321 [Trichonephila clavipes]